MEGNLQFLRNYVELTLFKRVYSYDVDTSLIVLCDPNTSFRKGVWVDVSLCLNPKYSAPWKREPMHVVTVVGYLEACEVGSIFLGCSVVTIRSAPASRTFPRRGSVW